MTYTITENTLNDLEPFCTDTGLNLDWSSPFILPAWMQVWWQSFGSGRKTFIRTIKNDGQIIGIAPLMVVDDAACFIGNTDVCDYQDFIIVPGRENEFFNTLLDDLKSHNITGLDLKHVRPDSTVLRHLTAVAENRGYQVTNEKDAVSVEMALPSDFEAYLESLETKQRHEVRRKMRRLTEEGNVEYRVIDHGDALKPALDVFYKMFVESREDKAEFLTPQMKSYFDLLTARMSGIGLLKLGVLSMDGNPVAEIMYFDYHGCIYLYNSGYDPKYVSLSAGLLSKVFAIKDSIEKGRKKYDFLKGPEIYKYRLGGQEVPLYRCRISLK
jgi:CelD/BcsL family acetyltransferase involved in cellulose biosynthesis